MGFFPHQRLMRDRLVFNYKCFQNLQTQLSSISNLIPFFYLLTFATMEKGIFTSRLYYHHQQTEMSTLIPLIERFLRESLWSSRKPSHKHEILANAACPTTFTHNSLPATFIDLFESSSQPSTSEWVTTTIDPSSNTTTFPEQTCFTFLGIKAEVASVKEL